MSAYSDAILALSPVAYWRLGEASGAVAADASGNGIDATYSGTITYGQTGALFGDADTAVLFGTDGWAKVPAVDSAAINFEFTDAFSVALWFQGGAFDAGTLVGRAESGFPQQGWRVIAATGGDNNVQVRLAQSSKACFTLTGSTPLSDSAWHLIVVTYDGSNTAAGIKAYIDGEPEALTASVNSPFTATMRGDGDVWIHTSLSGGTANVDFALDEVAVFASVLSAADAADLYTIGTTGGGVTPTGPSHALRRLLLAAGTYNGGAA